MAISRFQSRFKTRTDLMDNITPNNVVQMNASVPHGEWKPASWLPVVWQNEKSKDFFTISSGKIVSLDASGRVVPSGLLRRCLDATAETDVVLTYTQNDVDARVINISTGEFVSAADISSTASAQITLREFANALVSNGWLPQDTDLTTGDTAAQLVLLQNAAKAFISAPVGIAAYDVYVWAGDDPSNLHFTNYQKQHLIQFFTDIQMKVAHIAEVASAVTVASLSIISGATLGGMSRYEGLDMTNVIGLDLELGKVASHTSRTPVSFSSFAEARHRSDISLLAKVGDWYLDADAGIILFWEEGGNALPGTLAGTITVFDYDSSSSQERMMMLAGEAKPGDFISFDEMSNFVVASSADLSAHYVVGRLLALYKEPRGLLERVRTGFRGDDFDATAKMPGSATAGFSDLITLSDHYGKDAGDRVADEIAVVNVKIQ